MNEHSDPVAPQRKSSPTIYDVARAAGVSPSTVSRALNKPGRINARTERDIRDIAARLGYRLNPMARALPTGKTGTVGLVLSDITNPVYFDLIRGAEKVVAEHGSTLILAESQESAQTELAVAEKLQISADGLVLVASRLADEEIQALARRKPLVTVNREVPEVPAVIADPAPGLDAALEHLQGLGHGAVAYLAGPTTSWMNRLRWETLFERAVGRGMTIVEVAAESPTLEGGRGAVRKLLATGATAVVAYNDLLALGVLVACRDAEVSVPGRLSIVGFDDIFGADLVSPTLTTVRSPLSAAGERAMRGLLGEVDGVAGEDAEPLLTTFVPRQSTGAPVPR